MFAAGERNRRAAVELAGFLGPDAVVPDGPIGPALRALWPRLGTAVFFLGTEPTVRLVAPLLRDERADPGVVCVDGGFAVALLGGADALAERVADVLGAQAVTTSASAGSPLDELVELLDATVEGDLAACGEAIRLGEPVLLANPLGFPLPALPDNVVGAGHETAWTVLVDDRVPKGPADDRVVRVVPRTLVVGVGSSTGVPASATSRSLPDRGRPPSSNRRRRSSRTCRRGSSTTGCHRSCPCAPRPPGRCSRIRAGARARRRSRRSDR